ncbi:MAG: MurR/RpiR family transcriptional regulator [Actinomyces sp.]|jgi:DNA-binding MurR/RpiR family transcriptional regulator|nr:MurR/RpiR family transcriptional regulator [Actinomyces sp.]MCI1642419.1 MurR/RpiR family transcriptional regulator [Actinomyces sp.]MCI1662696.1 MurR/RpiR family transcriptional regulator [Actinomyces sp.]MCI1691341.1 MurR/RpiR family transcriptional regulator [Actinomyces sp.]MCI1788484.1 MurR/RpiR family transcriptional regulator [Actinomyces sp.]MCI1831077.1 MurR/RpiR family transcriptional regulator [Actinomyces sp.]
MDTRPAPDALAAVLREVATSGPSSLARVATYLLGAPDSHATETIGSIAEATGTSTASVTRLARRLGLSGFKELRVALATLPTGTGRGPGADDGVVLPGISWSDTTADLLRKLAAEERRTLAEASRLLDPDLLEAVAARIHAARRLVMFGVGASQLVTRDLAAKLDRIGVLSHVSADRHDALAISGALSGDDAAVLVSHSGTTEDVLEVARAMRDRGVPVIGLVSRSHTALAGLCDFVLRTSQGQEAGVRPGATSSRIGQMFASDALCLAVMRVDPARSRALLAATRAVVDPLH